MTGSADHAAARSWLLQEWISALISAIAAATGKRPLIQLGAPAPPAGGAVGQPVWHELSFRLGPEAVMRAGATQADWLSLGAAVLHAAGIDPAAPEDAPGAARELLEQTGARLAQSLGAALGRPELSGSVRDAGAPDPVVAAAEDLAVYQIQLSDWVSVTLLAAPGPALIEALAITRAPGVTPPPQNSKTLDLLMEVELPVSVSFGRAQLPLRDVLKLNSGSIVELNRTINDPVELIVNNCVVARGEVVVVDGNYGVRIKHVVSREERLRTLN
ncbi:MAG: flagellar motor switch protein FliN [Candidatus Solibacter usitatus]|nr:flagellar motor switch protein FliN [Candidatus Solibacter usitatus]